jgi:lysozyme
VSHLDICRAQLPLDEGRRKKAYKDSLGIWSAGVGRNLQDVEFSDAEINLMFDADLERADRIARGLFPGFDKFSDNRKAALTNLAFNMGYRLGGFANMRKAIDKNDWNRAAIELADSLWARQVQQSRRDRLLGMIRNG